MKTFVQITFGEFNGRCLEMAQAHYLKDTVGLVTHAYAISVVMPDKTLRLYYAGQFQSVE